MVLRALVLGLALSCYQLDVEIALFAIRSSYTESYITTVGRQIFLLYLNCFKILTL